MILYLLKHTHGYATIEAFQTARQKMAISIEQPATGPTIGAHVAYGYNLHFNGQCGERSGFGFIVNECLIGTSDGWIVSVTESDHHEAGEPVHVHKSNVRIALPH